MSAPREADEGTAFAAFFGAGTDTPTRRPQIDTSDPFDIADEDENNYIGFGGAADSAKNTPTQTVKCSINSKLSKLGAPKLPGSGNRTAPVRNAATPQTIGFAPRASNTPSTPSNTRARAAPAPTPRGTTPRVAPSSTARYVKISTYNSNTVFNTLCDFLTVVTLSDFTLITS